MMIYITNLSPFPHHVQISYKRCPPITGSLCTLLYCYLYTHTHGICNGASHDCSHSVSCGTLRDNEEVAQGIYFLREHRLVGGLMYHLIGQNSWLVFFQWLDSPLGA